MTDLVTATISGVLINPGGSKSVSRYAIEAATDGGRLTFDGGAIDGAYRVDVADDGTASVDIPTTDQAGLLPVGARWQLVKRGPGNAYVSKPFALTGDLTWNDIIEAADVPYTPTLVAQAAAYAALAEAAVVTSQAADTGTIPAPGKRVVAVVNPGGWIDDLIVEDI